VCVKKRVCVCVCARESVFVIVCVRVTVCVCVCLRLCLFACVVCVWGGLYIHTRTCVVYKSGVHVYTHTYTETESTTFMLACVY